MLSIRSLSKSFDKGKSFALKDVSFTLNKGDVCAVVGESGSGKTTLVRLIAGLERPDHGTIDLDGEVVSSMKNLVPPEKRKLVLYSRNMLCSRILTSCKMCFTVFPNKKIN